MASTVFVTCLSGSPPAGVEGEVIVQKLLGLPFEVGYNAMIDKVENLVEAGVIDPAKVTRNGLLNATSIAGILLTTQVGWDLGLGRGRPVAAACVLVQSLSLWFSQLVLFMCANIA